MIKQINSINITSGVKNIIFINVLVFFIIEISNISDLKYLVFIKYFSLIPSETIFNLQIWRVFTYIFIHGDFLHLFFNLLILFFIGCEVERQLGTKLFYIYYLVCGVGGGCLVSILGYNSIDSIIGSSGSIFGLLYSLSVLRPNSKVYLYFIFPMKISTLVNIVAISSLFGVIFLPNSQISHITHLCGMISGHIFFYWNYYLLYMKKHIFKKNNPKNHLYIVKNSDKEIKWESLTKEQKKKIININKDNHNNEIVN